MKRLIAWLAIVAGMFGLYSYSNSGDPVQCTRESIPFQSLREDNPNELKGIENISTKGIDGTKEVCKHKSGTAAGETIVSSPVNQVTKVGTKEIIPSEPLPTPAPTYTAPIGGGAICMDGWRSSSTGRGTCSHHGGVAEWL